MTNEELVSLIQSGVNVSENMGRLYEQNKAFIYQIAIRYSDSVDIDDLMQEAYFGLDTAVRTFDVEKEFKFLTYARYYIRGAVQRYTENNSLTKRLPNHIHQKIRNYLQFLTCYSNKAGKNPTDREIMEYLHISSAQLTVLEKCIANMNCTSLDCPIDSGDGVDSFYELVPDDLDMEEIIIDQVDSSAASTQLWEAVNKLGERISYVMVGYYKEKKTFESLANDLGISKVRACQLHNEGLQKLKKDKSVMEIAKRFDYDCGAAYRGNYNNFATHGSSITEHLALKYIEQEELVQDSGACNLLKKLTERSA